MGSTPCLGVGNYSVDSDKLLKLFGRGKARSGRCFGKTFGSSVEEIGEQRETDRRSVKM